MRDARDARGIEVRRTMAGRAAHADGAEVVDTAHGERHVRMPVVALRRAIAGRMTIHAAGVRDDLARLLEQRQRALFLVGDRTRMPAPISGSWRVGLRGGDGHADGDDRHRTGQKYREGSHITSLCLGSGVGERQREHALPRELRPRVGDRGRNRRRAGLADTRRLLLRRESMCTSTFGISLMRSTR